MENKFIRSKFDGLTEEFYKWDCISFAPFYKKEFKSEIAEKEIIDAYMHSAECLYIAFYNENNPAEKMKLFRTNQMCMPFLFLCRHTIELSIKLVIKNKSEKVIKTHKLNELWNELNAIIKIKDIDFNVLIEVLNEIDDDGCKLRYSNDGKGNDYKNSPCFVRTDLILETTQKLYNYLVKQGDINE